MSKQVSRGKKRVTAEAVRKKKYQPRQGMVLKRTGWSHNKQGKCWGEVHLWPLMLGGRCTRCGHTWWTPLMLIFDPTGLRPIMEEVPLTRTQRGVSRIPFFGAYATASAGFLPNWPRWLRVVSFLLVAAGGGYLVYWVIY